MPRYHNTLNVLLLISVSDYINNKPQAGFGKLV